MYMSEITGSGQGNKPEDLTNYDKIAEEVLKKLKVPKAEDIVTEVIAKVPRGETVDKAALIAEIETAFKEKYASKDSVVDVKKLKDEVKAEIKVPTIDEIKEAVKPASVPPGPDYVIPKTGEVLAAQAARLLLDQGIDEKYKKKEGA